MGLALLVMLGLAGFANCTNGCALFEGKTPTNPQEQLEHSYTTEVVACAAMAGYPGAYDRSADLACRAAVDCRYKLGPC
jgi:hypothetical protein